MTAPAALSNTAPSTAPDAASPRPRAFTAGFVDRLGERQLAFDSGAGISIEVLHLKKEFSESADFEAALRARVELMTHVQHASLSSVMAVERDETKGLTLVSKHMAGRRVSELVQKAHGPAFALELIRFVTPALAALQRASDSVAHGALSPDRIVVTRDGRIVVVEHVFGSALESLKCSRQQLQGLGLAVPEGPDPIRLDSRLDIIQLGLIALSLLLGRTIDPADYPAKVPALFDEFVQNSRSPILAAKMRGWLERATQLSPRPFASAREAQEAFGDLPDDVDVRLAGTAAMPAVSPSPSAGRKAPAAESKPSRPRPIESRSVDPVVHHASSETADIVQKAPARGFSRWGLGAIAGLGLLAIGEAVVIFALPYTRQPSQLVEIRPAAVGIPAAALSAPAAPADLAPPPGTSGTLDADAAPAQTPAPAVDPALAATANAAAAVPAGPRFGGITVTSSIELQVFKDGKLVGSTSGPLAVNEGPHSLEFINDALGFRLVQTVNVKGGQMTAVKIALPNGRISINAVPWAEVTINGTAYGETPLANLSLPIGTHEIVFKHPQFGERKQSVVVKVDGLVRVTQDFKN